eukprot:248400-Chlamydomonas_euryale.AAC.1
MQCKCVGVWGKGCVGMWGEGCVEGERYSRRARSRSCAGAGALACRACVRVCMQCGCVGCGRCGRWHMERGGLADQQTLALMCGLQGCVVERTSFQIRSAQESGRAASYGACCPPGLRRTHQCHPHRHDLILVRMAPSPSAKSHLRPYGLTQTHSPLR